ncbi:MAG: glycosyltransferase [Patescibacteria group bacterium]
MKVALVHDYIREYGGAERVLKTLTQIYPKAPIYTAFRVKGSTGDKEFQGKKIIECFLAPLLKIDNLYSPLRFLIPVIWGSFDLTNYDLVIASASWYVTRGFKVGPKTKVICYCHTPPRWLYGYETSVKFTKYWPVRIYAAIVGHFLRMYDFATAQKVDFFLANSKNVASRIEKFYRKDSKVIYPPVEVEEIIEATKSLKKDDYFLMVSRLVGAKGLGDAARLAKSLNFKLKIVGETYGFTDIKRELEKMVGGHIELVGRVSDEKLYSLYGRAKGFLALAKDEDFGMGVVEAQAAGTPVIAFNGGGFKESVVSGETGILIDSMDEKTVADALRRLRKTRWEREKLMANARKFSKERFKKEMLKFVKSHARTSRG